MVIIKELNHVPYLSDDLKGMLKEYGHYLFTELKLAAGKESFYEQLLTFPDPGYVYPTGTFVLAILDNQLIGCTGIKKFDEYSVEMKRMYVNPEYRGRGVGAQLSSYVINWAKQHQYKRILLDTNEEMPDAVSLYIKVGFKQILPYCINENDHALFMAYNL